MSQIPAVLIGGPPHSGKTVLAYGLSHALRAQAVDHYLLRAAPDGEGDWSNEAQRELVTSLRRKGSFDLAFVDRTAAYLAERQLPLLVDVGGRPTAEQEALFGLCSHAILLIADPRDDPAYYERQMAVWEAMMARQNIPVIARLRSVLDGTEELLAEEPVMQATLAGLERGRLVNGAVVERLTARLAALFRRNGRDSIAHPAELAPGGLFINLSRSHQTMGGNGRWHSDQLPALCAKLPENQSLAIYGRGPNWLYTALALHAGTAAVWFFNTRDGWVKVPELPVISPSPPLEMAEQSGWQVRQEEGTDYAVVEWRYHPFNLNPTDLASFLLPAVEAAEGVVLSGQIPHWLLAAAARQLAPGRQWLAVFQPQAAGAVVVYTRVAHRPLGQLIGRTWPNPAVVW